jgi:hypothetical protein
MNRVLDKIIDSVHRKLIDVEKSILDSEIEQQQPDPELERRKQQRLEIGRLTAEYEDNLTFLTNRQEDHLPNNSNIRLEPQHPKYFCEIEENSKYYHEIEERNRQEIQEYEDMKVIAIDNAAKTGLSNPKREMEQFAQYCKELYLAELERGRQYQKNIKTIIGYKGITVINGNTGEVKKHDIHYNPVV